MKKHEKKIVFIISKHTSQHTNRRMHSNCNWLEVLDEQSFGSIFVPPQSQYADAVEIHWESNLGWFHIYRAQDELLAVARKKEP